MNWYKIAQQNIQQQYAQLLQEANAISITGSGQNETLVIPGGRSILARELLDRVRMRLASILTQNHVKEINTDPIGTANAQGMAYSHSPGKIQVDISRIFNAAKQVLPPTSQTDGTQTDPDILNAIIGKVSGWIEYQLANTISHESTHVNQFSQLAQEGKPFSGASEPEAYRAGDQIAGRFFPRSLDY